MNFPLFVVDIDRLPILILLCLPQKLRENQIENVPSAKTSWRPSLRLSSQARKAAWPFETKNYALGSRKKYFCSSKMGGMNAPVLFKRFLLSYFKKKNYLYWWLTEKQRLEKP